jgi:Tol biopolymer transport system component
VPVFTQAPTDHSEAPGRGARLDSWKEIAAYLKRDIRTVQRWEKLESLPVHRHQHLKRGSAFAYTSEIDEWWNGRGRDLDRAESLTTQDLPPESVAERARVRSWFWPAGMIALAVTFIVSLAVGVGGRSSPTVDRPIRRLSVMPPADAQLSVIYRPTISPDGRLVALVGHDRAGTAHIWVRSLDSLTPTLLADTEGAGGPFWSPDSQHLAFFAGGKLKRINLASGRMKIVCDAPNGRGGTWVDDTILFAPYFSDGLYTVPASGGALQRATELDRARGETSHRWPQFLPDRRHFIFFALGGQDVRGTHVASLGTPGHTRVLATDTAAAFSLGYLLFWHGGNLDAQPFDDKAGRIRGDALVLPERLNYDPSYGLNHFSVSDNGVLVYHHPALEPRQLTWYDRAGTKLDAAGPVTRGPAAWVTLAPSGDRAAVQRWGESPFIWLGDVRRGVESRFSLTQPEEWPVWSPTGTQIAFASTRDTGIAAIYTKAIDAAGGDQLILRRPTILTPTDWSRDGKYLIFQSVEAAQNRRIGILSLSAPRTVVSFPESAFDEINGQFSPSGKWIAYASNESGTFEIYVRPFPGVASSKQLASTHGGYMPRWRRDGKELFYVDQDRRLMAVSILSEDPLRFGSPQPLFELPIQAPGRAFNEFSFDVDVDGKRFLVSRLVRSDVQPLTVVLNWTSGLQR